MIPVICDNGRATCEVAPISAPVLEAMWADDPLTSARVLPVSVGSQAFGHQIFSTGHVHCDPHPGNLLVRLSPPGSAQRRESGFDPIRVLLERLNRFCDVRFEDFAVA